MTPISGSKRGFGTDNVHAAMLVPAYLLDALPVLSVHAP